MLISKHNKAIPEAAVDLMCKGNYDPLTNEVVQSEVRKDMRASVKEILVPQSTKGLESFTLGERVRFID